MLLEKRWFLEDEILSMLTKVCDELKTESCAQFSLKDFNKNEINLTFSDDIVSLGVTLNAMCSRKNIKTLNTEVQ